MKLMMMMMMMNKKNFDEANENEMKEKKNGQLSKNFFYLSGTGRGEKFFK